MLDNWEPTTSDTPRGLTRLSGCVTLYAQAPDSSADGATGARETEGGKDEQAVLEVVIHFASHDLSQAPMVLAWFAGCSSEPDAELGMRLALANATAMNGMHLS